MVAKIEQYLMTSGCRRLSVLSHFDSEIEKSGKKIGGTKECCDNCRTRQIESRLYSYAFITDKRSFQKLPSSCFSHVRCTSEFLRKTYFKHETPYDFYNCGARVYQRGSLVIGLVCLLVRPSLNISGTVHQSFLIFLHEVRVP